MLRRREMLVITFRTTTQAMAMEAACKEGCAPGRLIPVPRVISAGCGLAWCAEPAQESALTALMERQHIAPQGVYRCLV